MSFSSGNFPAPAELAASRVAWMAQIARPSLPPAVQTWMTWALAWKDALPWLQLPAWREGAGNWLAMQRATDTAGLWSQTGEYRFGLDLKASTPGDLRWIDGAVADGWSPHWLVLTHGLDGDPLIGDMSRPEVPVLWKWHDEPHRAARPLFASLEELMAHVQPKAAKAPLVPLETRSSTIFYTVRLLELGHDPARVMLALRKIFTTLSVQELLKLKTRLPLTLLDDSVSVLQKDRLVQHFGALGARVEVSERRL